ncbi:MAG: serine hydrolase domain-containing protein [Caldilineaceae bacterium]
MTTFPTEQWQSIGAAEAGFDPQKLTTIAANLRENAGAEGRYRVVIVRGGRLIAEWYHGVERDAQLRLASATKSLFSSILGILLAEGALPSADAPLFDYYPEFMNVLEGTGPKPGRYAYPKDRTITFRQLISNTSGYMKPGEEPGQVFNYQTYGMNILTHALAGLRGDYDSKDPEGSPGLRPLLDEKLRVPIGATWGYYRANFALPPTARINIFGYYDGVQASALDMARLGWLWCNWGNWAGKQIIPAAWLREATTVAPAIRPRAGARLVLWLCLLDQCRRPALADPAPRQLCCLGRRQPAYLGLAQPGAGRGAKSGSL